MENVVKNKRGLELVTSLYGSKNMFRKVPFLVIDHLSNFDDFIQNYFWVIPKITFANLCKPVQSVIIILVSSDPLILETDERKGKKYKKLNIWKTKRAF